MFDNVDADKKGRLTKFGGFRQRHNGREGDIRLINGKVFRDDKMGISAQVFYVCKPDETGVTVIIDTDAAKLGRLDAEDIWASREQLREVKNRIFFGSITETAAGV